MLWFAPLLFTACAIADSHAAHVAQTQLVGLTEVDLESCLGVPDQHASFGDVDVLTYYTASSSSTSYSIPVIGGLGFSNGGNCHATFDLKDGHVVRLLYSGEKNAFVAPDAYCAPIMTTCLGYLNLKQASAAKTPVSGTGRLWHPPATASSLPPRASEGKARGVGYWGLLDKRISGCCVLSQRCF
jgi:hypothetical protein